MSFVLCKMKNMVVLLHGRNSGISFKIDSRFGQVPQPFWLQLPSNSHLPANLECSGHSYTPDDTLSNGLGLQLSGPCSREVGGWIFIRGLHLSSRGFHMATAPWCEGQHCITPEGMELMVPAGCVVVPRVQQGTGCRETSSNHWWLYQHHANSK